MDYTQTKKAFRQIEEWRKEIGEKEQKHINNITDKNILLYLAKKKVKNLSLCAVGSTFYCVDEQNEALKGKCEKQCSYCRCK